jgi:amphi-Trp domain-containing protein
MAGGESNRGVPNLRATRSTHCETVVVRVIFPAMPPKRNRDVEKVYPLRQFIAKIRRLADDLESRKRFSIQLAGERIAVPADAIVNIEHERQGEDEELEFQIKWKVAPDRPGRPARPKGPTGRRRGAD